MKKDKILFTAKHKDEYMIDMRYFYENNWLSENIPIDEYLIEIEFNLNKEWK